MCRRYLVLLAISSVLWNSTAQAFFCFSRDGEGRHRENHYSPPPPIGPYLYDNLPVPYYSGIVLPQRSVAPVEFRNADYPDPDPPVAPIELPDDDYPVPDRAVPIQHIFH